jgi:RNA polymerase sigma factor for flagellar operon FliA
MNASERSDIKQKLLILLKALPEKERLILALSYHENLDFDEIASVLDIPVKNVTKIYKNILDKLKSELKVND